MPDVPPVVPGSTSPATPPAAPPTAPTGPEYASKAELAEIRALFESRLQSQSDLLGGIRNDLKGLKPKAPEPKSPDDATLTERIKAIETREAKHRENLRFGALKSAAMSKGVTEKRAEQFAKIALVDHGSKISVTDDFQVLFKESDDKTVNVTDWATAYLQTQDGEIFLPPKPASSSDGQSGGGRGASATNPFLAMTFDQIQEAKKTNWKAYEAYMQEHPEDFEQKQKQWRPR